MGLTHYPHGIFATPNLGGEDGYGPAPELFGGKTYYVNNVSGSDDNTGEDPNKPLAQINKAIIKSESYRKANWGSASSPYRYKTCRNRIYVAGTGVYYDGIDYSTNSCDPHHCDIIGVGDNTEAGGDGQVNIGSTTTDTVALHTATNTGTGEPGMFGTRWYNVRFTGGGATKYAVEIGKCRGSGWYNCNFTVNAAALGSFLADEMFAGCTIQHCTFSNNAGGTAPVRQMYFSGSTTKTDNRIEDNVITGGSTAGITYEGYLTWGSIIKNNTFLGLSAHGIVDTSTYGVAVVGNFFAGTHTHAYDGTVSSYAGNFQAAGFDTINT